MLHLRCTMKVLLGSAFDDVQSLRFVASLLLFALFTVGTIDAYITCTHWVCVSYWGTLSLYLDLNWGWKVQTLCVIWVTDMCPMVAPWMLCNLHTHLHKLSGTFMIFLYSCFLQICQLSGNFYWSKHNSSVSCLEDSKTPRMWLTQWRYWNATVE